LTVARRAPPPPAIPAYGQSSLADLVPSLLSAVGAPGFSNPLGIEPAASFCLLVIDGLGLVQLRDHASRAPFLASLAESGSGLTAGFPATTAASIGSIGTGLPPGQHGLVGYTFALPGQDRAMNALQWALYGTGPSRDLREEFVPERVQPEPTAFERAAAAGIEVALVGPPVHARSGMSRAVLRGGRYRGVYSLGDLIIAAAAELQTGRRTLVYAYHADLDTTGHVRGVASDSWQQHLSVIDGLAAAIADLVPPGSALAVTGDHGMIDLEQDQKVDVADRPSFTAGVRLLAGEARARHVYAEPGAADDVLAAWQAELGEAMWVASREQAIDEGWFGPIVADHVRPRIGDVVAAAHGPVGVFQKEVDSLQPALVGHHGSLTPDEQLVPLAIFRK
jgi:type I phosphodiesterase/nucleotide pyrophosphatase